MRVIDLPELTEEHRVQLEGDEEDPFEHARAPLNFRPKEGRLGLVDGERLVAAAGWVNAEVKVAGASFPVLGVGGVIVNHEHRGRGFARRVVQAVLERTPRGDPDFAMLFCLDDRAGLYQRLGFEPIAEPVTVDQPGGPTRMPLLTMWRALKPGAEWPAGPVALQGLPF